MAVPSTRTKARLDPLIDRLTNGRLYLAYQLTPAEYIGTTNRSETWLREQGYESTPTIAGINLEAAKRHPANETRLHDFSLRKRPQSLPAGLVEDTGLDGYRTRQLQFHIHGFEVSGETELYAHLEAAPDLGLLAGENVEDMLERLHTHYNPTYDRPRRDRSEWTYIRGVSDFELPG